MKLYWIWAMPAGTNDRLHEAPLCSFARTAKDAEAVKSAASKDGWHGFRMVLDTNAIPDFTSTVNRIR